MNELDTYILKEAKAVSHMFGIYDQRRVFEAASLLDLCKTLMLSSMHDTKIQEQLMESIL